MTGAGNNPERCPALRKRLRALGNALAACLLFGLAGCGILGKKAPEWISGTFTPDGKYYVFTYSTTFITQYSKRGNMTRQQGIIRYYLQAIDCATGKERYAKPPRLDAHPCIMAAEGDNVWLAWQHGGQSGPALFSLGEGRLKFGPDDVAKANPGIPVLDSYSFYRVPGVPGGLAMDAGDGRRYAIDPRSGVLTLAPDATERIERKDMDRRLVQCKEARAVEGYATAGSGRYRISAKKGATTADDFIDPQFVTLDQGSSLTGDWPLMEYRDGLVLVSQMTTGLSSRETQVALLDKADLHTRWAVVPPQGEYWMGTYNMERFALRGNQLYVANRTHFTTIDADNGTVLQSRPLVQE